MTALAIVLCLCALVLTGQTISTEARRAARPPSEPLDTISDSRPYASAAMRVRGANAMPRVIIFTDYECGACRLLERLIPRVSRQLDELGLGYVQTPLPGHSVAAVAARASVCADAQRNFAAYHSALFAERSLRDSPWLSIAARLDGIDTVAFTKCMGGDSSRSVVNQHQKLGEQLGVVGTPTILVDRVVYVGLPSGFPKILDAALEKRTARQSLSGVSVAGARIGEVTP